MIDARRLCALAIAVTSGGLLLLCGCQKSKPGAETTPSEKAAVSEGKPKTAGDVLARMVTAYKNAPSYSDHGTLRIVIETDKQKKDQTVDFSVALVRPDKFRANIYGAAVVCDGRQWHAFLQLLPGQVVARESPKKVTMEALLADPVLSEALTKEGSGMSPQLVLLLGDEPLKALLGEAEAPTLGEAGQVDGHDCYRVEVKRAEGTASFWIDQESYVLRRVIMPTDEVRAQLEQSGEKVQNLSVVAEFVGAQIGGEVDARAFQFETPAGAELVKFFTTPDPMQLLGGKVPDFKFLDAQGKPVTPKSLAGKIVVLDFWATWCGPCRASLPNLETVYQKYKDNDKFSVLAISVDDAETPNSAVADTLKQLKVTIPSLRDPDHAAGNLFKVTGIPSRFLLGADGTVQDCEMGDNPKLATELPEKLEKLLGGADLAKEAAAKYQEHFKEITTRIEAGIEDAFQGKTADKSGDKTSADVPLPQAKIAPHSDPKTFKLTSLWKCKDLAAPGNILVQSRSDGPSRLLVLDSWRAVAELGLDGKLVATHKFDLEDKEAVCSLRSGTTADGKRYLVGFATAHQRFHLLDENWKQLFSFPQDALQNPHKGMSDVELADLDGDGSLLAYVGYWDVVGVQAVSLEGKRLWSQREGLTNVARLMPGPADAAGHRPLLCINGNGTLVVLDSKGQRQSELSVSDWPLRWMAAGELAGDGHLAWCGLSARSMGEDVALGFNLKGDMLWNYPMSKGSLQQPIEQIISGKITHDGPGQWLLPGADGSISIISLDGKLLDQFNYGASLSGLATADLDGKPALIVASGSGLEALRIER